MPKSVHKSVKKRKCGQAGQGVRIDQAGSIKHWKTKVIDVWWWGRVLVAGEWLKMIQKSENEG